MDEMARKYERTWSAHFNVWEGRRVDASGAQLERRPWSDHDRMAIGLNYFINKSDFRKNTHVNAFNPRAMDA